MNIKQLLHSTPVNMRRLVEALHFAGSTVNSAVIDEDGDPQITLQVNHSDISQEAKDIGTLLLKWGCTCDEYNLNVTYLVDSNQDFVEGQIVLYDCTDDDFDNLPQLTVNLDFTPAQLEAAQSTMRIFRLLSAAARAAHEVNRSYCEVGGDTSQKSWAEAPNWQLQSALDGVRAVVAGQTPEQLHESWMLNKVSDGWRYGEVKDADAKTHPCIRPYHELPVFQRRKDDLFHATVRSVLGLDEE